MPAMLRRLFSFLGFGVKEQPRVLWDFPAPVSGGSGAAANTSSSAELRQNLRLKCGFDEAKIDRLIEHERAINPNASQETLMEAAIERWERDSR